MHLINPFKCPGVLYFAKGGHYLEPKGQSPVAQSIVSITSLLRGQLVKCFLAYNQIH